MTVADNVRRAVSSSPILDEAIQLGIVNFSALARYLRSRFNPGQNPPSDAALKAALLRLRPPTNHATVTRRMLEEEWVYKLLSRTQLQLKDDIVAVAFPPSDDIFSGLRNLLEQIDRGDTLHIVMGYSNILVILDQRNIDKIFRIIPRTKSRDVYEDLASVVLTTPKEAMDTPGISYIVYRALFLARINILFESSVYNDTVIIVEKNDAILAYQTVRNLLSKRVADNGRFVMPPIRAGQ